MKSIPILAAIAVLFAGDAFLSADEIPWPDKNGPLHNGCALPKDAVGVPVEWDDATGKNIAWKIDLEGFGHSTPVVGDGRIWLTAASEDGKEQFVYSVDAESGKILHHLKLFENAHPEPLGNVVNTYASPSCVLEHDAVYVHFGTYGTARLDPRTAEIVWKRRDIPCRHFRGPGSSPIVWNDLVVLTFDGIDQQFVIALDKRTGKTVWRTDRSTDFKDRRPDGVLMQDGDNRKGYGTPATVDVAGQTQLVSVGSRAAFGYDARSGKEIWTVTHRDFNASAPPLFFKDTTIINTGSGGTNLMAIRLDESTKGNVDKSHIVWNRTKGNSRLSSPALQENHLWMLTDNGVLYAVDAENGKELAALRLGGAFVASPVIAGTHLYACNEDGGIHVISATIPPKVEAQNHLPDGMRSSPAIADGAIYLRTFTKLYKIAATP